LSKARSESGLLRASRRQSIRKRTLAASTRRETGRRIPTQYARSTGLSFSVYPGWTRDNGITIQFSSDDKTVMITFAHGLKKDHFVKKRTRIEIAREIISSLKKEMQRPRLTESVRNGFLAPKQPRLTRQLRHKPRAETCVPGGWWAIRTSPISRILTGSRASTRSGRASRRCTANIARTRVRTPKLPSFGHWRLASLHRGAFFIYGRELCPHLITFEAEEPQYPLTVSFAGGHKHPHWSSVVRLDRRVCSILLSVRAVIDIFQINQNSPFRFPSRVLYLW